MRRFEGKVAIVTGSSAGIGQAIAVLFASEGAKVVVNGRNEGGLEETKEACLAAGISKCDLLIVAGDVTEDDFPQRIVQETVQTFGKIDILVNNAGIMAANGQKYSNIFDDASMYDAIMDTNLKSIIRLTKEAIPELRKTKGNVVNMSSISSLMAFPQQLFYGLSKCGLDHVTKSLALQFATQVRINSINAGFVQTRLIKRYEPYNEELYKAFESNVETFTPMRRFGSCDEIARAVAFLADERDSSFITGHNLVVDGGSTLTSCVNAGQFGRKLLMNE